MARADFLAQARRESVLRVAAARQGDPDDARVRAEAAAAPPRPSFAEALAADGMSVITEIKRASPSRGHMADIPDPAALANAYRDGGARAISVLTEPDHFHGSPDDLRAVAGAVDLPIIRKDFIVDARQLVEARAMGASAALLIVAMLSDAELVTLLGAAADAGLDVLVETHSAAEIDRGVAAHRAVATGRRLILGVNARDLVTLEVDRSHITRVRAEADLPADALLVAESGIRGPADVREYAAAGADAVLVGEHVATADDPRAAVAALANAVQNPQQQEPTT